VKNYTKILSAAISILVFSGCLDVTGTLSNNEEITLKLNGVQSFDTETYEPGVRKARVTLEENDLVLIVGDSFFNRQTFVFKNTSLSLDNIKNGQKIVLKSEESGQPYDIQAQYFKTEFLVHGLKKEKQACNKIIGNKVTNGFRIVTFRTQQEVIRLEVDILNKLGAHLAQFDGKKVNEYPEVVSETACM
jgi:hypothetical protein